MAMNLVKLPTGKTNLMLRVCKGHFATSHSHINYYIDVTLTKSRLSEARAVAAELVKEYTLNTIVDTILCLDGTEVIGACMASELTKSGYANMNAHQTIYVVTPEHTVGSQLLFRENTAPMIAGNMYWCWRHRLRPATPCKVLWKPSTTMAVCRWALRQFLRRSRNVPASRSPAFSTPTTCRIMRAMTLTSAPGARPVRRSTHWSTALDIPACKKC